MTHDTDKPTTTEVVLATLQHGDSRVCVERVQGLTEFIEELILQVLEGRDECNTLAFTGHG